MELASILELTTVVLKLSLKLYDFFNALRDAPEEIKEYLATLDLVRKAFCDVQDYMKRYGRSAFYAEDGMSLRVVEEALKDCEIEFSLQLSFVETMDPAKEAPAFIARSRNKAKWVRNKEIIQGLTRKLEKLQGFLNLAVTTSMG